MTVNLKEADPTRDGISEDFREKTAIVSAVLKQKALAPGIYLRQQDGKIKPAKYEEIMTHENMGNVFVDYKKEDVLSDKFDTPLEWPDIDFIYDSQLRAVFADEGRYVLKFFDDAQDKADRYLYYYLSDKDAEYHITGYLNFLKVRGGGKDRVKDIGMDKLQKWQGQSNTELPESMYFNLIAVCMVGMPLVFAQWEASGSHVTLGDMPAMTATVSTEAKDYNLGVKGEHPLYYRAYIDSSSKVKSKVMM